MYQKTGQIDVLGQFVGVSVEIEPAQLELFVLGFDGRRQ